MTTDLTRRRLLVVTLAAAASGSIAVTSVAFADARTFDVVIYGGTSSGVAAAVQARRMGRSVVLVAPDKHLGGLTSGGLGMTDSGRKEVIGGLAREFYRLIKAHYDRPQAWTCQKATEFGPYDPNNDAMWVFEPHVAERTFEHWIRQYDIPVVREEYLDRAAGVAKEGTRIVAITTLSGRTYRGRMFLDATYEGDLMAAAGVSYHVGRESNAQYGETLNGVQTGVARAGLGHHQFVVGVDPYVRPGDPASGLLPFIDAADPGEQGRGDRCVQAYNFRMCLTDHAANRVPFVKPEGYNEQWYELLFRNFEAGARGAQGPRPEYTRSSGALRVPWINSPMPNRKTDTNNQGAVSTDFIGQNYDYPEADYAQRRRIVARHQFWQQGLMWTLAHHPRVPEKIRAEVSRWGLARDEFVDNGNWPHQIYVREARRMVAEFVITENHLCGRLPTPRSIGMGSYQMDSHHVQRYVTASGEVRNEGDVQVSPGGPYPIGYGALVPPRNECTNLLVPVCVSSSHIAYGSIRMEPVFMILGQSAATVAVHALEQDVDVQAIDYARLRQRLLDDGQVLEWNAPRRGTPVAILPEKLDGVVVDDQQAKLQGQWLTSSAIGPFVGAGYRHDGNAGQGTKRVRFETNLKAGRYEVRLSYSPDGNRASRVPVAVYHAHGRAETAVNQKNAPPIDRLFISLGTFAFGDEPAVVEISNRGADGYVIADAVQFLPAN